MKSGDQYSTNPKTQRDREKRQNETNGYKAALFRAKAANRQWVSKGIARLRKTKGYLALDVEERKEEEGRQRAVLVEER